MVGMTLQQLGDCVGLKFQQIQKYEAGTNRISVSRMWDIAAAMEVPVSFFFEGIDGQAPDAGQAHGDILSDKESHELVRAYYAIPKDQRRRLFDLACILSVSRRTDARFIGTDHVYYAEHDVAPAEQEA